MTKETTRFFLVLTMALLTACDSSKLKSDIALEKKFEQLTKRALLDTTAIHFRLDTLTNFSWDTLIVFPPYSQVADIEEKTSIDLSEIEATNIESIDSFNVLAFIKGGQLINYVELPRDKGDFPQVTDTINIFAKEHCIFESKQTDREFVSGQKIVVIKPVQK